MVNVRKLMKLEKEQLVDEIRNRDFEITNLRKEVKRQSERWRDFYQTRDWRYEKKREEELIKLTNQGKERVGMSSVGIKAGDYIKK